MKSDEDTPLFADGAPREPSIRNVLFNLSDDLESTSHAHVYSGVEQERLKDAESIDYLAPSSRVYKNWLSRQVWGRHWDRWVVMALIGVLMGVVGFTLHLFSPYLAPSSTRRPGGCCTTRACCLCRGSGTCRSHLRLCMPRRGLSLI